jgi:hypothetical protein
VVAPPLPGCVAPPEPDGVEPGLDGEFGLLGVCSFVAGGVERESEGSQADRRNASDPRLRMVAVIRRDLVVFITSADSERETSFPPHH